MSSRKLSAGDTIEARCTRCRSILNHTIVAMVEERVVRVQCNTCGGVHNYHREKEAKAPAKASAASGAARRKEPARRPAVKEPGSADREEWESLRPTMEQGVAVPYNMAGK